MEQRRGVKRCQTYMHLLQLGICLGQLKDEVPLFCNKSENVQSHMWNWCTETSNASWVKNLIKKIGEGVENAVFQHLTKLSRYGMKMTANLVIQAVQRGEKMQFFNT